MKKNFFSVTKYSLFIGLTTFGLMTTSCHDDLQEGLTRLEKDAKLHNKHVHDLSSKIDNVKSSLDQSIAELKANLETRIAKLEAAQGNEKLALEKQVKENASKLAKLEVANKSLEQGLEDLKTKLNGLKSTAQSEKNAKDLKDLAGRLKAVETMLKGVDLSAIKTNKAGVDANKTSIEKNTESISALKTALETLKQVNADLKSELNQKITNLKDVVKKDKEALETYKAEALAKFALQSDVLDKYQELLGKIKNHSEEFAKHKASTLNTITELKKRIAELEKNVSEAAVKKEVDKAFEAAKKDLTEKLAKVNERLNVLENAIQLKGLVLEPASYYAGIEAIDLYAYKYLPVTLAFDEFKADADNSSTSIAVGTTEKVTLPSMVAIYNVNPSGAEFYLNKELYSYAVLDRKYHTLRSAQQVAQITVHKVERDDVKGQLKVFSSMNSEEYNKINTQGDNVTVAALQYKKGKDVVTSDYAALYNATSSIKLAYTEAKAIDEAVAPKYQSTFKPQEDLYTDVASAIAGDNFIEVPCKQASVDLKEYIHTLAIETGKAPKSIDTKGSDDKILDQGFEYKFALVGYAKGGEQQSAHFAFKDGHLVRPQSLTSAGKQAEWEATKQKVFTNEIYPIVLVVLHDKVNKTDAAYGFMKFKIVDKAPVVAMESTQDALIVNYTQACGDGVTSVAKELVLAQTIEKKLVKALGIDQATFDATYKPDTKLDGSLTVFKQFFYKKFNETTLLNSDELPADKQFGTIKLADKKLSWMVGNAEAYSAFSKEKLKEKTVYVRYILKNAQVKPVAYNDKRYKELYVKLTWKPAKINIAPKSDLASDKISNIWFAKDSKENGSAEIHVNQEVPNQNNVQGNIKFKLTGAFAGNKIQLADIKGYEALNKSKKAEVVFMTKNPAGDKLIGVDGKEYLVKANGAELTAELTGDANPTVIAVLKNNTSLDGTLQDVEVEYKKTANDYAQNLLNYRKSEAENAADNTKPVNENIYAEGETLRIFLALKAKTCAPKTGDDDVEVPVDNSIIPLRIDRPVNVKLNPEKATSVQDAAISGTQKVPVNLEFFDWRNISFDDPNLPNERMLWDYYNVSIIEKGKTEITTNLKLVKGGAGTLGITKLIDVNPNLSINFIGKTGNIGIDETYDGVDHNRFGYISYENNGLQISEDFIVRVPIIITYSWGKVDSYIDVTIKGTESAKKN